MTNRAAQNLADLDRETDRLLATCRVLTEADRGSATLCQGWDVAHLLTHVARNADSLSNLLLWATDGVERQAYVSAEQRDADIESGARRPLAVIVADVKASAARFRELAEAMTGDAGLAEVVTRTGTVVKGHQVIAMRILEVVFHHVDLRTGCDFDDADPDWTHRTLRRGAAQWERAGDAPALTLRPEGMDPVLLGGGGPDVVGTVGQLLLWLARGEVRGLSSDAPLPVPPPWA
ncbi:maleylpyruvate isomerase family mycothiol-dependent enzyme [Ornithinimicrobium tianjinense]|uniref:Maleylpyruvate isomerase n=1 Tax=Ornithinimicrobium tianjinense TaxID=1195761 RepID=A0A917BFT7_9MICO|nr:maleylpyruvate isomerase family mycothiol-dependent enzyme [Ornithinimicrobium tianjinense]GGF40877.1 maleylpyruvate isomerase [Ornithinimicrobium tianjinense]